MVFQRVVDCPGADFLLPSSYATSKNNFLFSIWLPVDVNLNYFSQGKTSLLCILN